jgi:hypothetical protein
VKTGFSRSFILASLASGVVSDQDRGYSTKKGGFDRPSRRLRSEA